MSRLRVWPELLGAVAAVLACAAIIESWAAYLCISNGGRLAQFGLSCDRENCLYLLSTYLPWPMLVGGAVLVGAPVYLLVSEYAYERLRKRNQNAG